MAFPEIILALIVYAASGIAASYYFFVVKRKDLLGGFWGGAVIGLVGAVLVSVITSIDAWFIRLISWLMIPRIGDSFQIQVNLIASVIGGLVFVAILNRINHSKDRRN
ncbi:MAG: hypothetical protein K8S54_18415 [Spirochaetia bacterium]|nr:hypothetical protein [Spirochaetia bacterium]